MINRKIFEYNVMINRKNFLDQPLKSYVKTYNSIRKFPTGQKKDYATGHLLNYNHFKKYCNMIVIDLSKQQALDAGPKAIQQINFPRNLDQAAGATMFFIIEETKEMNSYFSQGTMKVL